MTQIDQDLAAEGWHRPDPQSVAGRWSAYYERLKAGQRSHEYVPLPVPALDTLLKLELGHKQFSVLALPWEPGGETPFHIAQAAAKHGANPLCVYPSWSPHWDGTLQVRRADSSSLPPLDYKHLVVEQNGNGLVIIDQFSRLHWDTATTHVDREDIARKAGRDILAMAKRAHISVLVIVRRKGKGPDMTLGGLRSDGALSYDCDTLVMADPDHTTATAVLHIAKDRNGLAPQTISVDWPVLPRTVYRGNQH